MAVATATRASDRARSQRWRKAESRTHSSSQRLVAWFDRALVTRPGLAKRELAPLAVLVRELLGRELRGTLQRADRLAGKRCFESPTFTSAIFSRRPTLTSQP